ncbi:MAG: CAP domain-containing protein [Candidatus Pacebacteria bacterium]|nr:CAP domain-containing protein [Candidatus Paceibacterota bacterium]
MPKKGSRKSRARSFHHLFLPSVANDHHPHILKREVIAGVLIGTLLLEVAVLTQGLVLFKNPNYLASVLPAVVASLTNDQRTSNGLDSLTVSPLLSQAAQEKADDMAAKGYFSHVSPDGTLPWSWFAAVGYDYTFAGENLAINFNDSAGVVNAWMASPEHRANILKTQYTQEGIGIATGMYEGKSTTFVVQFFATPADAVASAAAAVPPTSKAPVAPIASARTSVQNVKAAAAVPPTQLLTTTSAQTATGAPAVLGTQTEASTPVPAPSILQLFLASPFTIANDIFVFIAAFALAVLIASLIFRRRLPRMTATISGLTVVVVVFGFAILNQHYFTKGVAVDQVSVPTSTTTNPAAP